MKPKRDKNSPTRPQDLKPSDDTEPLPGKTPVPVIFFVALGLLMLWAGLFLTSNAGGFNSKVYGAYHSVQQLEALRPKSDGDKIFLEGKEIYGRTCVPCHQPNGAGVAGQFPPLAGSEWVLAPKADRLARIVLNGLQGPISVSGTDWNNAMVAWRDVLTDSEIASVLTYIRNEWGNKAAPVSVDSVKQVRGDTKDQSEAWTAADLQKISDQ